MTVLNKNIAFSYKSKFAKGSFGNKLSKVGGDFDSPASFWNVML